MGPTRRVNKRYKNKKEVRMETCPIRSCFRYMLNDTDRNKQLRIIIIETQMAIILKQARIRYMFV